VVTAGADVVAYPAVMPSGEGRRAVESLVADHATA